MRYGILVELTTLPPVLRMAAPKQPLGMDGWLIECKYNSYHVREVRDVGLKVNSKAVKTLELVENDYIRVGRTVYVWKEFELPD